VILRQVSRREYCLSSATSWPYQAQAPQTAHQVARPQQTPRSHGPASSLDTLIILRRNRHSTQVILALVSQVMERLTLLLPDAVPFRSAGSSTAHYQVAQTPGTSQHQLLKLVVSVLKDCRKGSHCESRVRIKVTVSIPAFDLFLHPRITPFCIFSLTYSCTCLELFPRGQSMQVHDLAKNEWILFTAQKWMQSTHGNSGL
jgi:hypothetical protein